MNLRCTTPASMGLIPIANVLFPPLGNLEILRTIVACLIVGNRVEWIYCPRRAAKRILNQVVKRRTMRRQLSVKQDVRFIITKGMIFAC
jgi:hypothetical protein